MKLIPSPAHWETPGHELLSPEIYRLTQPVGSLSRGTFVRLITGHGDGAIPGHVAPGFGFEAIAIVWPPASVLWRYGFHRRQLELAGLANDGE